MKLPVLLLAIALTSSAQAQRWHSEVEETAPGTILPYSCEVKDFRNAKVGIFTSRTPLKGEMVQLRRGSYEHKWTEENGYEAADLTGNYEVGSRRVLIVSWEWAYGSSSQEDVVQVLECHDGHWTVTQQIETDQHAIDAAAPNSFNPRSRTLLLSSTVYGQGAHCCPEFYERLQYHWNGERFLEKSRKLFNNK